MLRFANFFRDGAGNESMTALMLFLSWIPATYVMVVNQSENLYYAYMTAFAGLAANKQWANRNASNASVELLETDSAGDGDSVSVVTRASSSKRVVRKK